MAQMTQDMSFGPFSSPEAATHFLPFQPYWRHSLWPLVPLLLLSPLPLLWWWSTPLLRSSHLHLPSIKPWIHHSGATRRIKGPNNGLPSFGLFFRYICFVFLPGIFTDYNYNQYKQGLHHHHHHHQQSNSSSSSNSHNEWQWPTIGRKWVADSEEENGPKRCKTRCLGH